MRATVGVPVWVIALMVLTIALLLLIVWSVKRRRRPNLREIADVGPEVVETRSCGRCVRGLLCHNCNVGLGHFHDSPDALRSAISYLERVMPATTSDRMWAV